MAYAATHVTMGDLAVTNLKPTITTATVAAALKGLKTTPTNPKVAVPSASAGTTTKATGKLVV